MTLRVNGEDVGGALSDATPAALGTAGQRQRVNAAADAPEWSDPDLVCTAAELATTYAPSAVLRGVIAYTSDTLATYICRRTAVATYAWVEIGGGGGEAVLPRLAIDGARHHWRLDGAGPNFADLGSSPVSLNFVSGTREYGRAGVYARYGATMQRSPAGTDRCDATIAIGAATDLSIGVTVANEGSLPAAFGIIAAIHDNSATPLSTAGLYLLTGSGTDVFVAVHAGGGHNHDSAGYSVDWSRPHRLEATYSNATKVATLYVDGVARVSTAPSAGTMAALTRASIGGLENQLSGCVASTLMMTDFTVHTSVLSAATVLSRADVCRRLAGG